MGPPEVICGPEAGLHSGNESWDACLGKLFRQGSLLSVGFKLLQLPIDPCSALFWAPKNLLHFLKHHRGKMIWHCSQKDGDGVGEMVSTVSFAWLLAQLQTRSPLPNCCPKPHRKQTSTWPWQSKPWTGLQPQVMGSLTNKF